MKDLDTNIIAAIIVGVLSIIGMIVGAIIQKAKKAHSSEKNQSQNDILSIGDKYIAGRDIDIKKD